MQWKPFDQNREGIKQRIYLMLLVVLSLVLAGCKADPRVEFIQGAWYYNNAHLANIPAESAQVTSWEFDNYYFSTYSCCFVETYFSGNYSIEDRQENQLTLELFDLQGQTGGMTLRRSDTMTLVITIDEENDTLKLNGDGPYTRTSP